MLQIFSQRLLILADETIIKEWEDRMERAATTASSLKAKPDNGNINRTQSMTTLNESFPQGTDLGSGPKCQDTILGGVDAQTSAKTTSWNKFSSTMASAIISLATNKNFNFSKYIFDNMVKNLEGEKKSKRKQRKDNGTIEPILDEAINEEHVATPSCDLPQSGEDRIQLTKLMNLCTQLQSRVLALETTKSSQALEIESLKRRVKSLEKRRKSRTSGFKRLRKGMKITDLDADAEVTLVDETQEINDDNLMFDTSVLEEQEKEVAKKEVSADDLVTIVGEVVTTANVEVTTANAPTTTIDELTLAQTLIEIKAAKPKAITSATTTTTTTRPKARVVVVQEPSEFKTTSSPLQASQLP
ncbi:hypothetical protein Tco_1163271 [Tanacetum coccineum]